MSANLPHFPVQKRVLLDAIEIEALELAAQGFNQREIGDRIGRTRSAVGKMLRRTEKKLAEMLKDRGEQIKALQTTKLEHIYNQAMQSWTRSKQEAKSVKTVQGKDGEKTESTIRDQCGDPRFLDQARGALGDIRKIWGLDEINQQGQLEAAVAVKIEFSDDFFDRAQSIDGYSAPAEPTSQSNDGTADVNES